MASLGKLVVDLAANTAQFEQGITRSAHLMGRQTSRMKQHVNSFSKSFGRMNLVAQAGLAALNTATMTRFATDTDHAAKMATRLGVSVEQFTSFRAPLEKAGIELNTFGTIMQRVIRRSSEAAKGGGEAAAAFREMGIDATKFVELDLAGKVMALAEAYQEVEPGDFLRLIQKIGDTEATVLGQLYAQGPTGLQSALDKAKEVGDYTTKNQARNVETLNDQMAELESRWRGFINPLTERAAGRINNTFRFFENIDSFLPGLQKAADTYKTIRAVDAGAKSKILSFVGLDEAAQAADSFQQRIINEQTSLGELKAKADETSSSLAKVFDPEIQNEFKFEEKLKLQAENLKKMTAFARAFVLPDLQEQAEASDFSGVGREIDRARTYLGPSAVTGGRETAAQRQLERATELLERIEYNTKRKELEQLLL